MMTPAFRCLRAKFPDAQIDMVVRQDFFDLIRFNPRITNKIGLSRGEGLKGLWELKKRINAENYDIIYDAHRSLRTLVLMPFLRAKQKFYFQKHYIRRTLLLLLKLPVFNSHKRTLERSIEPLGPLGVTYDGGGPEFFLSGDVRKTALEKVALPPPKTGGTFVGIIPSAQWPGKRWSTENFKTVCAQILERTPHSLIVFGGKGDTFCQEILEGLPKDRAIDAQGKLSIAESGALVEKCKLVIANDTGLMHVADALKVPSVLFLGPTSGELGCLPFQPGIVLEHEMWCRPCSKNGEAPCIRGRRYCLENTTPEMAFDAFQKLVATP